MKRSILTTLAAFWAALAPSASFATSSTCTFSPLSTPGMTKRGRFIRFPDGREITIIGHNHGSRAAAEGLRQLAEKSVAELPNDELRENLAFQLEQQPDAAHDSKQDLAFLRAYLAKHPEAKFVGVEGSQKTVSDNLRVYKSVRALLHHQLEARKLLATPVDTDVQVTTFGAHFYLQMTEPGLFAGRKLLGIESDSLGKSYLAASSNLESAAKAISAAHLEATEMSRVATFVNPLEARYPTYRPEHDDAGLLREAQAKFKGRTWAVAQPYLRARLALMKAMKLRDRNDRENIARQTSSGVVFIGKAHLDSLANLLKLACETSLNRPLGKGNEAGAKSAP